MKSTLIHIVISLLLACIIASYALPLFCLEKNVVQTCVVIDVQKPSLPSGGKVEKTEFQKVFRNKLPFTPNFFEEAARHFFEGDRKSVV